MLASGYALLIGWTVGVVVSVLYCWCCDEDEDDRADQPPAESPEQRLARAWAEWQASAASAQAVLAALSEASALAARTAQAAALTGNAAAPPVPLPLQLPYFPYAAQGDKPSSETVVCAICLEELQTGQLCSEVPRCRHIFHNGCLGEWARSNGSCPLCRAKIVPGSDEVAVADDMV